MDLERIVKMDGAFDNETHGIHGVSIYFVLKGEKGAVSFTVYSPMYLERTRKKLIRDKAPYFFKTTGAGLFYHSSTPRFEDQECHEDNCCWLGTPCYSDGSFIEAEEFIPIFLKGGSDAVWKKLEEKYEEWFGDE